MKFRRGFPVPWDRWSPLLRTLAYSASLVALLSYLSYRFIFAHPDQVRRRAESSLSRLVRGRVAVEGARHQWDEVRLARVALGEAGGREPALELRHVAVFPPGSEGLGYRVRPGRALRSELAPDRWQPVSTVQVAAREARLRLGPSAAAPDPSRPWWQGWNLGALWRPDAVEEWVRRTTLELRLASVAVEFLPAEGRPATSPPWDLEDVRLLTLPGGFIADGNLPPNQLWESGYFEVFSDWTRVLKARFRLENCRDLPGWKPFVSGRLEWIWEDLQPRGVVSLEAHLQKPIAAPLDWRVNLECFDTSLRISRVGLEVTSLRGRMVLRETGILWGKAAEAPPSLCTVWGVRATLSGSFGETTSDLRLDVPRTPLERLRPSLCPPYLRGFLEQARPTGHVSGWVSLGDTPQTPRWNAELALRDAAPARLPAVRLVEGTLRTHRQDDAGEGTVEIGRLTLGEYLGDVRGQIDVRWDTGTLIFEAADLEVLRDGRPTPGRIGGRFERRLEPSTFSAELRWKDLGVRCGLLRIERASGELRTPAGPALRTTSELAWGLTSLEGVRLPAEAVKRGGDVEEGGVGEKGADDVDGGEGGDGLSFQRGRCLWTVREWGIEILPLHLEGEVGVLRAYGRLAFDGEVDLFCLLATGPKAQAVDLLDLKAPVSSWVPEGEGDDEHYEYWRIQGSLAKPTPARLASRDFVFLSPFPEKR